MIKRIIPVVAIVVLTGATIWYFNRGEEQTGTVYRFVEVEQGDLEALVSSTGILGAVTTVQVGTQVSGIVSRINVDFNDNVKKGQVIAQIDTTLLVSAVKDARTVMARNTAQLGQAEREFERVKGLYDKQFITEVEYNQAKYNLDIAKAALQSGEISLQRALQNLSYATIYAPISGTIIERNVDVGQTVAASFSAPQLFLIANDLSKMQILASVDESDIGQIKEGQTARFTVQAYSEETFEGVVRQVRLQSTIQENVVNYTVVIDVDNAEGRLLPGMTATVDFLISSASDVLKISNAALRFRPTESMMAAFRERRERERANQPDSLRGREGQGGQWGGGRPPNGGGGPGGGCRRGGTMLWYLDETGQLAGTPVRIGISDGQMTQIEGRNLTAGMQIIAGVTEAAPEESSSPFQSQQQGQRPPGGF